MAKLDASAVALGRKIAFFRTARGLSQREFGALVDRSEAWVSQVERGERRIDRTRSGTSGGTSAGGFRQAAQAPDRPGAQPYTRVHVTPIGLRNPSLVITC